MISSSTWSPELFDQGMGLAMALAMAARVADVPTQVRLSGAPMTVFLDPRLGVFDRIMEVNRYMQERPNPLLHIDRLVV
ncbi:MAG TPA: hypothetical protein VL588_03390 [Bdellovibrionota bacterium]|nr:hypothetical protein [Bdellovibrionota bacterium]